MFGRRFPFLPSNWCQGILVFKREGKKGASEKKHRGGSEKKNPTELPSSTEPKLGFNGPYTEYARLGSLCREKGGDARIIISCFYLTAQEKYCVNT